MMISQKEKQSQKLRKILSGESRTSSFAGLATLVAILAGVIILKKGYSIFQGVATVLVIVGIYLANMAPGNKLKIDPESEY